MEIQVNKDLRKIKTKDIWLFSGREAKWVGIAIAIAGLSLFLQTKLVGTWTVEMTIFPAVPALVIGFLKIQDMYLPDYIRCILPEKFLMPSSLKWESDFKYTPDTARELFGEDYDDIPMIKEADEIAAKSKKSTKKK